MNGRLFIYTSLALGGMWAIVAYSHNVKPLERVALRVGNRSVQVEVAREDGDIRQGLMHRQALPYDSGMLFILRKSDQHCFWMKNTSIPLSVAFLDERGRVLNVADMEPKSERKHCAAGSSRFAIEVNLGLFQAAAVKTGTQVLGLPEVPQAL